MQVYKGVAVGVEAVEVELERVGVGEGDGRAIVGFAGHKAGNIHSVGHAVVVVVKVVEVGRAVAVAVEVPAETIYDSIAVAIGFGGVAIPCLAAKGEADDFGAVVEAVEVGILALGVCAEQFFFGIGQAVAIGIEGGGKVGGGEGGGNEGGGGGGLEEGAEIGRGCLLFLAGFKCGQLFGRCFGRAGLDEGGGQHEQNHAAGDDGVGVAARPGMDKHGREQQARPQ